MPFQPNPTVFISKKYYFRDFQQNRSTASFGRRVATTGIPLLPIVTGTLRNRSYQLEPVSQPSPLDLDRRERADTFH